MSIDNNNVHKPKPASLSKLHIAKTAVDRNIQTGQQHERLRRAALSLYYRRHRS